MGYVFWGVRGYVIPQSGLTFLWVRGYVSVKGGGEGGGSLLSRISTKISFCVFLSGTNFQIFVMCTTELGSQGRNNCFISNGRWFNSLMWPHFFLKKSLFLF